MGICAHIYELLNHKNIPSNIKNNTHKQIKGCTLAWEAQLGVSTGLHTDALDVSSKLHIMLVIF